MKSGLEPVTFGHEVAVGPILQSEPGLEVCVLVFVTPGGITLDRGAVSLSHTAAFATAIVVLAASAR